MLSEISSAYPIIFTIIWQSSLFIAAGLIVSILYKRHPARAHQVVFLSMIAAVAVPFLTITVKHLELGMFIAEPEPAVEYVATSEVSVQPYDNHLQDFGSSVPIVQPDNNSSPDFEPSVPVESEKLGLPWTKILLAGWVAASVIFLARLLLAFILGNRVVKKAKPFEFPKIAESIKAATSRLGIKEDVAVYHSKSVSSPVIWCWKRRPVLLFPSGEKLLNNKIDLVGILCHELAHLKRRDHVAGLLSEFMIVFLPWHPLLWWAKKRVLTLSEHACDDWVIAAGSCGMNYAESLLDFVPVKQMAFVPTVVRDKDVLKERVIRMLKESYGNPCLGKKWIISAVLITTCITLTVAFAQTRSAMPEEEPDMAREEPANEGATPAPDISALITNRKKMLENPDMMNLERRMQENMVAEKYGALFERLGLPDEKIQDFKTLMVDYAMQGEEMYLDLMDQSLSKEERIEKIQLFYDQQNAELEKQVKDLMGAEDYEIYDAYHGRLWEHQFVTQYVNPPSGENGLSDEKVQELIDAMYEVRKDVETEYGLNSYDGMQFFIGVSSNSTEEERTLRLAIWDRCIESARDILSETQAEDFEAIVKGMQETMISAAENLANEQDGQVPDISDLMTDRKKMLENPDSMNMERRMQEKMIVENYGTLFERLGLPNEKIQAFKTLIVDYQMQGEEMSLDLMDQSLSKEERREKMQLLGDQQMAEFQKQARGLLGAENYEKYDAYKRRITERFVVTQFVNFPGADDGLSDEKEQELIDAMYEVRKEVEAEYGADSSDSPRMLVGVTSKDLEEGIDKQFEVYDRYVESARGILAESQVEQFEAIVRGMQETTIVAAETASWLPEGGDDDPQ